MPFPDGIQRPPNLASLTPEDRALAVSAMLNEYNTLRQESMSSIGNRVTIANFTFGAVAVILAAFVTQDKPSLLMGFVAMLLVPQISKVGLLIWLGEYGRSQRAGKWIAHLEQRISKVIGLDRVIAWETALLGRTNQVSYHMNYPYMSVVLLLLGVGWTGIAVGATILANVLGADVLLSVLGAVLSLLVVATLAAIEVRFALFFRRKWRKIKDDYSEHGPDIWEV
jgi:hypothetical protein